jgi:hypothetical protein
MSQELAAAQHTAAGRDSGPSPMNLIRSTKRVADHGEVFTPSRLVEKMFGLVKAETERIDSRFLGYHSILRIKQGLAVVRTA